MHTLFTRVPSTVLDPRLLSLAIALALVAAGLVLGVDTTDARGAVISGGGHRPH